MRSVGVVGPPHTDQLFLPPIIRTYQLNFRSYQSFGSGKSQYWTNSTRPHRSLCDEPRIVSNDLNVLQSFCRSAPSPAACSSMFATFFSYIYYILDLWYRSRLFAKMCPQAASGSYTLTTYTQSSPRLTSPLSYTGTHP
jgi:hypothetical protein